MYHVEQREAGGALHCLLVVPCQWAGKCHVVDNDSCLTSAIIWPLMFIVRHPRAQWLAEQRQPLNVAVTNTHTHITHVKLELHNSRLHCYSQTFCRPIAQTPVNAVQILKHVSVLSETLLQQKNNAILYRWTWIGTIQQTGMDGTIDIR